MNRTAVLDDSWMIRLHSILHIWVWIRQGHHSCGYDREKTSRLGFFLEEAKFVVVALSSHWLRMVFWTWFSYVFMFLNCHIWMSWLAGVRWIHQSMKTAFRKSFNFSDLAWRRRCSPKFNTVQCNFNSHIYCMSFTTWEIEFAEFPKHDLAAKICSSLCQGDRQCLLAACSAVERICQDNLPFRSLVCAVFLTV